MCHWVGVRVPTSSSVKTGVEIERLSRAARERGPTKRGVSPLRIARVMRDVGREGAPSRAHLRGQRPTPPTLE